MALPSPSPLTWQQLVVMISGRMLFATAFRMVYPLIPFFARGFAIDLTTAGLLITVQVAATMLSPLGGILADRWGERPTMLSGLLIFVLGSLLCGLGGSFPLFLVGYALVGGSSSLFNPAMQAYASNRSPYQQRGRVLGLLEISWAASALIGVTSLTWLIELRAGWGLAYLLLAGIGLLLTAATFAVLPPVSAQHAASAAQQRVSIWQLDRAAKLRIAATMLFALLALASVEMILIVYAEWLERDFSASLEQIGLVFGLLGIAELAGSLGSTLLVDRMGKRRSVVIGFLAVLLFQAILPFTAGNWGLFLVIFLLFGLWFEFGIVSLFPLISGLAPQARGTVIALGIAMVGLGRVVGSIIGPSLFSEFGFLANGLAAVLLSGLGLIVCVWLVREGER